MADKSPAKGWTDAEKVMKTINHSVTRYHGLSLTRYRPTSSSRSSPKAARFRGQSSPSRKAAPRRHAGSWSTRRSRRSRRRARLQAKTPTCSPRRYAGFPYPHANFTNAEQKRKAAETEGGKAKKGRKTKAAAGDGDDDEDIAPEKKSKGTKKKKTSKAQASEDVNESMKEENVEDDGSA